MPQLNYETEFHATRGGAMGFVNSRCEDFEATANQWVDQMPFEADFRVAYYEAVDPDFYLAIASGREMNTYLSGEYEVQVWRGEKALIVIQSTNDPDIALIQWE